MDALDELAADPRARFPLNDLPLILEHAAESRARREPRQKKVWGPRPARGEAWNRLMLERGTIDRAEFERRSKECR